MAVAPRCMALIGKCAVLAVAGAGATAKCAFRRREKRGRIMPMGLRVWLAAALAFVLLVPAFKTGAIRTSAEGMPSDEVTADILADAHPMSTTVKPAQRVNGQAHAAQGITGLDSLASFNGHFHVAGFDSSGNPQGDWYTNTVGHMPGDGGTTTINAPIIPLTIDLLNADGTQRSINGHPLIADPSPYVNPILNSPLFSLHQYSSSPTATQFSDAIQRAEFYRQMAPSWHTVLNPSVKTGRTMRFLPGTYRFALNEDGSCCQFVLLNWDTFLSGFSPWTYPIDDSTPVGAAELAGDITTKDLATFLLPNTFFYFSIGDRTFCCIVGDHAFDYEPGATSASPPRAYVINVSAWISPGLFSSDDQDIAALSHELAEIYNDPFQAFDGVHDVTPWWLAPNGNCMNVLETGDVIENLPNATYPITMNGMTYHPQNEALVQWFESAGTSDALDGAFSYPDEAILPRSNVSRKIGCQP